MDSIQKRVLERFVSYAAINTESDSAAADSGTFPSTPDQRYLADILTAEFAALSIHAECTDDCYVIADIPPSRGYEHAPRIMFCAHLDTSDEVSGKNVTPVLHTDYDGSVITFTGTADVLDPAADMQLASCAGCGDTIITSDGTTLLGGDDKAGIAAVMTAVEYLCRHPEVAHGPLQILFSPDEETGHGMDRVPDKVLQSYAAYTVDGGAAGEIEAECFNAYRADVTLHGVAMHLGYARKKMCNAVTMAADFIAQLPRNESPETTDGYDGYYCPLEINGSVEKAHVTIFLRDFTAAGIERRITLLKHAVEMTEQKFPGAKVELIVKKQYLNMKQRLDESPRVVDLLNQAVKNAGSVPIMKPIRGGTDGSRLTEMGLPTPNIFTGGHNFHSRTEWVSLQQLVLSCKTVIELIVLYANENT